MHIYLSYLFIPPVLSHVILEPFRTIHHADCFHLTSKKKKKKAIGRNVLKELFESILGYQLCRDKWVNLNIRTVRNVSMFPASQKATNYLPKYEIEHSRESTFSILKQMSWAFKVVLMFNVCLLYMTGKPILPEKEIRMGFSTVSLQLWEALASLDLQASQLEKKIPPPS